MRGIPSELLGKKFGRLQVKKQLKKKDSHIMWLCLCECGNTIRVPSMRLNSGNTQSCGCLHRDVMMKKRVQNFRRADCHPSRKHYGKGLCVECWSNLPKNLKKSREGAKDYQKRLKRRLGKSGYTRHIFLGHLKSKYHLTEDAYRALLKKQKDKCPCGRKFGKEIRPNIDHDHTCCPGVGSCGLCIRGLLCRRCNMVLGLLNEDSKLLPKYLLGFIKR